MITIRQVPIRLGQLTPSQFSSMFRGLQLGIDAPVKEVQDAAAQAKSLIANVRLERYGNQGEIIKGMISNIQNIAADVQELKAIYLETADQSTQEQLIQTIQAKAKEAKDGLQILRREIGNLNYGQGVSQTIANLRARAAAAVAKGDEKINRGRMISAEIKKLKAARRTAILEQKALFSERLLARIQQATAEAKEAADTAQVTADPAVVEQLAQTAEAKVAEAENALQVLLVEVGNPEQTAASTSPLNQPALGEGGFPVVPVVIGAAAIIGLIALFTAKK